MLEVITSDFASEVTVPAPTVTAADPEPPASSSSNAITVALIVELADPGTLCACAASLASSGDTRGAFLAVAAAFDDLAQLRGDTIGELLRGRRC